MKTSASAVCLHAYLLVFAGTQCAYPRRNGQAELIWVADYIPYRNSLKHLSSAECRVPSAECRVSRVTHPSTNRARRRLTLLTEHSVLAATINRHEQRLKTRTAIGLLCCEIGVKCVVQLYDKFTIKSQQIIGLHEVCNR